MKKSRFSEEQIAYALRQADTGTPVGDVCRQVGVNEVRRVRQFEDENARLKRLVADLTLDKHMLAEALRKKSEAHTAPRAGALVPGPVWRERPAGLPAGAVSRAPRGIDGPVRRTSARCASGSVSSLTRARASATCASGCCCGGRAGW